MKWLSREPLKDAEMSQGPNLYSYVKNCPTRWVYQFGLYSQAQISQAESIAGSSLIGQANAAADADNVAAYYADEANLTTYGETGQTLGTNPVIDDWENSLDSYALTADQDALRVYDAFARTPADLRRDNAEMEMLRQLSLIRYVLVNVQLLGTNRGPFHRPAGDD